MRPGYRIRGRLLGRRSGGRLLGRRRFGYGGGRRPGFRDAFRRPRLRFRLRGRRWLRRQAVGRFSSWRCRERLLSRRSGRRLLGGRRFGYSGGPRPGFRDAFRCSRLRFGFRGQHWLRRQAVGRFGSWRCRERLLSRRLFGRRLLGRRRFGYSGGQRLGFRYFFRCPRLRFRFWGGRRVVDRFGSWRRLGRLLIGRSGGRLRDGIGGRISGRRRRRRCLVDPVRLQS